MEAASRGAKEAGGQTLGVTAKSFQARANKWVDEEIRMKTWRERLFELIKRGHGYVVCPGGMGTLVELAVVWEMLNKGAMAKKPMVVLGDFWQPLIERVLEVELGHASVSNEKDDALIHCVSSPVEAAEYLQEQFEKGKRERRSLDPSEPGLFP
jgi:predicted Rossmann-fold nucleotide-binding protein